MIPACKKIGVINLSHRHKLSTVAQCIGQKGIGYLPEPLIRILVVETSESTYLLNCAYFSGWISGVARAYVSQYVNGTSGSMPGFASE
jgi:hypothetical protein